MDDSGEVWALDRTHSKAAEIASLASSFGLKSIRALKADATRAVKGNQASVDEGEAEELTAGDEFEGAVDLFIWLEKLHAFLFLYTCPCTPRC